MSESLPVFFVKLHFNCLTSFYRRREEDVKKVPYYMLCIVIYVSGYRVGHSILVVGYNTTVKGGETGDYPSGPCVSFPCSHKYSLL